MKKNLLVSVIIPVYNEESHLADCLLSIAGQSYKNIETIVVDDGSSDKSVDIAQSFEVGLLKQKHKGAGAARNKGARRARGQILVFPDADMRYHRDYIKNLIRPILLKKTIGTFNKKEFVANTKNIWSNCWSINSDFSVDKRNNPEEIPDKLPIFRAIVKKYFIKSGGFDEKKGYTDDDTISTKLNRMADSVDDAICYHYNPETLRDVFYSARWIGRGASFERTIINLLRFSPPNTIRNIIKKLSSGAPPQYILFKSIYDAGIFIGIFLSFGKTSK